MKGKLFVVEDNLDLLGLYRDLFVQAGFTVEAVTTGEEALRRYRQQADLPDVIILDHRLPGCTGLDVARALLADAPEQPIILTTADDSVRDAAIRVGIRSFRQKPVSNQALVEDVLALTMERHMHAWTDETPPPM